MEGNVAPPIGRNDRQNSHPKVQPPRSSQLSTNNGNNTTGSNERQDGRTKDRQGTRDSLNDPECRCCTKHSPRKPQPKKYMPCQHAKNGRNLILCIDGTAQKLGENGKTTNVIEMFNLLMNKGDDNQLSWYTSGLGTYARPRWKSPKHFLSVVYHKIDSIIAWDIERIVQEAYQWLAENYQDGDCIFIFGFSRGAFQARALSAMVDRVGLVHKGNISQIPYAYEHYARTGVDKNHIAVAKQFKESFSREVKIHFVGAWDTVAAVGTGRGHRALPGTIDGMTHVCYFRHALALDERRVMFQPEYAYGGSTASSSDLTPPSGTSYGTHPQVLEVWFPGTHSDIGCGPSPQGGDDTTRGRPPLRWMATHAAELGLRIKGFKRDETVSNTKPTRDSLSGPWHLFEYIPLHRLTFARTEGRLGGTTRIPHLGRPRKIHEGQMIHYSVLDEENYLPKARPKDDRPDFWTLLRTDDHPDSDKLLHKDMFYNVVDAVKDLLRGEPVADDQRLKEIVTQKTGRQFLYDEVVALLRQPDPKRERDVRHRVLKTMLDVFPEESDLVNIKLKKWSRIRAALEDLLDGSDPKQLEDAREFERRFSKDLYCVCELRGHKQWVNSVAISADGKRIASGASNGTVRVWDAERQVQVGLPLRGHANAVYSIALLPDGRVVSGSIDKTIRIWNAETGRQVGEPLRGHTGSVACVVVSSDGKRIVSASSDKTIRIWDSQTREQVQMLSEGQGEPLDLVNAVEISQEGK